MGHALPFSAYCQSLINSAAAAGWRVVAEKSIPYGRQYHVETGAGHKAVLNAYTGKKGFKYVAGGRDGAALTEALGGAPAGAAPAAGDDPFGLGLPRVGGDESGKGDFFGPLVVAAFFLDDKTAAKLKGAGITDSKKLSDAAIEKIAGLLDKLCCAAVVRLMPREYNPRYREIGNLNVLLAQMHGECVRQLIGRKPKAVIIDQFATDGRHLRAAIAAPAGVQVVTRTKGEADLAVAAASILARAEFVRSLRELEQEFGASFPPGAGSPVLKAGRAFVKTFGREQLANVAKLHFKTTQQL